ncbi:FadR/GntR family transcriptional regulator [Streptomyces chartreusis]|uniref:FadR/GntR family transcriptional regulator n=1 Tax=Streptomyces chartreusis TaxID=1969 RepID=UPI00362E3B7B
MHGVNLSDRQTAGNPPLQRITPGKAVLAHLRRSVERRDYVVGESLPSETELARTFAVGRTVVREALQVMDAMGLTLSSPEGGTYVTSNGPVDNSARSKYLARDVCELRRRVEIPMARYAATRRSEAVAAELLNLLDQMEAETDVRGWASLDRRFHAMVAKASANTVYGQIIIELSDVVAGQSMLLNTLDCGRHKQSHREHRAIGEAIANGLGDLAAHAMEHHLNQVETALIQSRLIAAKAPTQGEVRR